MLNRTQTADWQYQLIAEESLCVIIPTYNNDATIKEVITQTYKYVRHIIVVNDGSTDNTATLIRELQNSIPIRTISHTVNKGKGQALVTGFRYALSQGYKYAITIDSDGQHLPSDIPMLISAEEKNIGSIIIGSRNLQDKDISNGSLFANKFSNFWLWVQTGHRLPDTQTGFRLYPLYNIYWMQWITSRYEAELELLVFAFWHGVSSVSVPINVYYPPQKDRVSHFRPGLDFIRISILNTILCGGAILYGYPRRFLCFLKAFLYSLYSLLFFVIGCFFVTLYSHILFKIKNITPQQQSHYHCMLWKCTRYIAHHIPGVKFTINNDFCETFEQPSIIICNHQSWLDLMFVMMTTPKMIILTNDWVWNNFIFGSIIKYANFYPISNGIDETVAHVNKMVKQGYSVLVFPEGTRSMDCSILHFHKGAFYIAEQLNLDIIPFFLWGSGIVLPKKARLLRNGNVYLEIGDRILCSPNSKIDFRERAKSLEHIYRKKIEEFYYKYANCSELK